MKLMTGISSIICVLLIGCTDSSDNSYVDDTARTTSVSYVCVGMETSQRFGKCPGCKYDSDRVNSLYKNTFNYNGVLLQSSQATREAVIAAIKAAVKATPADGLFIFYYSGHGASENLSSLALGTSEPEGADEEDEYLCLYDSYLLDDEIWNLITPCRGRVFLVFDCCHSQTMFRSVSSDLLLEKGFAVPLEDHIVKSSGFTLKPRAVALGVGDSIRMLCWSGCAEAEVSYGSNAGGVLTNSILARWKNGITYDALWKKVVKDVTMIHSTQHPKATQYGDGFNEAFR